MAQCSRKLICTEQNLDKSLINDQIYSFTDRGERERWQSARNDSDSSKNGRTNSQEAPKPIRWYSIPNLMRYERPQRGRLREHWQFNVDLLA